MGLLDGKRIVVTGVLTDASLAFGVAKLAQEEGAEVVLTGAGRGLSLTERTARKLPSPAPVFELDVSDVTHVERVRAEVASTWDRVDGVLHAIGYAPPLCLGGTFMEAGVGRRRRRAQRVGVLAQDAGRRLRAADDRRRRDRRARLRRHAWRGRPTTGWAWPRRRSSRRRATWRASSVPSGSGSTWWPPGRCARWRPSRSRASPSSRTCGPTGRRSAGTCTTRPRWPRPASRSMSDWFPLTTGEMVHVDGGYHAMGA